MFVRGANILEPTNPVVRRSVSILDVDQWRAIGLQDVPGAPPHQMYYNAGYDGDGRGKIYLRFQPPAGYILELYTWLRLRTSFESKDDVALFPDGYSLAIVYNLAKHLAAMNPTEEAMSPRAYDIAESSLATLISLNTRSPRIEPEPGFASCDGGSGHGWLDGGYE
jgi:hypothetical protein